VYVEGNPSIAMPAPTTTASESAFAPETTVGTIVAEHPALARFFEHLGIDYCCHGRQPLGEACVARGLDVFTTLTLLESAAATLDQIPTEVNAVGMTLIQLADHIEQTHHLYTKTELPRLVALADRVAASHGERDPRLREVVAVVRTLTKEMLDHMEKEETVLFPLIRRVESEDLPTGPASVIAAAIRSMETEHDDAGRAIDRLRTLTDKFASGNDFCNSHRALLAGFAAFEADLHRHVHKENNILFPRVLGDFPSN
jgi:regulator of cell morphogenesis and NO signaling